MLPEKKVITTLKYVKVGRKLKEVSFVIKEIIVLNVIPKIIPIIDIKLYITYLQVINEFFLVGKVIEDFSHPDFLSLLIADVTLKLNTIVDMIIKACGATKYDMPKPMTINVIIKLIIDDFKV